MSAIRLVCFDLGGVVLRICRSWAEGCTVAGLDVHGDPNLVGDGTDGFDALNDRYQRGAITIDAFAEGLSAAIAGVYSPAEIIRVHMAWTLGEYDGVSKLIENLHAAGLDTAVLSNTTLDHWRIMPRYPAFGLLRNRIGSHEIGLRKPEPAAYRAVERQTGMSGEAIIFFDDLKENVAGAREVGWRAMQIDPAGDTAGQIRRALIEHGVTL